MTNDIPNWATLLREARIAKGLSQGQFAKLAHIDPSYISRIEAGKMVNPTIKTLARLLGAVGLRLRMSVEPEEVT